MVNIKPKTVVTMKLDATCPTHSRTDVAVRDVTITVDEPKERGGTNLGPSPTETLMASLAACTNVITHKVAKAHGVDIANLSVGVEAAFDRRGVTLTEAIDVPFPEVMLHINLTTDADEGAVDKVKTDLARFCPVSRVIRQSGTALTEVWTVTRP